MSRVALTDSAGNVTSISTNGALVVTGTTAITGANISSSAQEVLDQTWRSSFTASVSTQSIKVGAGVLYGYLGTTAGTINFALDNKPLGAVTVSAGVIVTFPCPIHFASSLSASASSAVCTVFYK
jgi:hypothetical protein